MICSDASPDWRELAREASLRFGTPIYLFYWPSVLAAISNLDTKLQGLQVRHWLSFKTQPVRRLIEEWYRVEGRGVEVVSSFELQAALQICRPEDVLVNGVGKSSWLRDCRVPRLRVQFDSLQEVHELAGLASRQAWHVGLRYRPLAQHDSDNRAFHAQFGLTADEVDIAVRDLRSAGCDLESIHFHLHSNVENSREYIEAAEEVCRVCNEHRLQPRYIDCGGGLPCPGDDLTNCGEFDLDCYGGALLSLYERLPSLEQIWLENGRFLLGRAGALVIEVMDTKHRTDCKYLICNGGRTNHALVSDWEQHEILVVPERSGQRILTTVCGPTCMAFDHLTRRELPEDVGSGDLVVWLNAGAYHIGWETQFSYGFAPVVWIDADLQMTVARDRQSFDQWWQRWK